MSIQNMVFDGVFYVLFDIIYLYATTCVKSKTIDRKTKYEVAYYFLPTYYFTV